MRRPGWPASQAADALGGVDAVELRHLDVHQHQIVGRAGGFRRQPGFQRLFAVGGDDGVMAEPAEQRAHQQRVDLVVLGDQDRQARARRRGRCRDRRVGSISASPARPGAATSGVGGQAGGERGRAQRLDQIAGEGGAGGRLQLLPRRRREHHDALGGMKPRGFGRALRCRPAPSAWSIRTACQERSGSSACATSASETMQVWRAPALQPPRDQRGLDALRRHQHDRLAGEIRRGEASSGRRRRRRAGSTPRRSSRRPAGSPA